MEFRYDFILRECATMAPPCGKYANYCVSTQQQQRVFSPTTRFLSFILLVAAERPTPKASNQLLY